MPILALEATDLTTPISAPFAICVIGRPVSAATADHRIQQNALTVPSPGDARYTAVTLRDVVTDTVIDQFDSWDGATPYGRATSPPEARRPSGPLATLLSPPPARPEWFQRIVSDRLFTLWGTDEQNLRAAMSNPAQSQRAEAVWFACRDDVRPTLSAPTLDVLRATSTELFPSDPDWRYPENCPDFARHGIDEADRDVDIDLDLRILTP